jgi:hypothetical protein
VDEQQRVAIDVIFDLENLRGRNISFKRVVDIGEFSVDIHGKQSTPKDIASLIVEYILEATGFRFKYVKSFNKLEQ